MGRRNLIIGTLWLFMLASTVIWLGQGSIPENAAGVLIAFALGASCVFVLDRITNRRNS